MRMAHANITESEVVHAIMEQYVEQPYRAVIHAIAKAQAVLGSGGDRAAALDAAETAIYQFEVNEGEHHGRHRHLH